MQVFYTNDFIYNSVLAEKGIKFVIRGYCFVKDNKKWLQRIHNSNINEFKDIKLEDLQDNCQLVTSKAKTSDEILDDLFDVSFTPTLELSTPNLVLDTGRYVEAEDPTQPPEKIYETKYGGEAFGEYRFRINSGLNNDTLKGLEGTYRAIALIGEKYTEDDKYMISDKKSYLAMLIYFDGAFNGQDKCPGETTDGLTITDDIAFTIHFQFALSELDYLDNSNIKPGTNQMMDIDPDYRKLITQFNQQDQTTIKWSTPGIFLTPKGKEYSHRTNLEEPGYRAEHEAISYFDKNLLLIPESERNNNIFNITTKVMIFDDHKDRFVHPQMMLSYGGVNEENSTTFIPQSVAFEYDPKYFALNEKAPTGHTRFDLFGGRSKREVTSYNDKKFDKMNGYFRFLSDGGENFGGNDSTFFMSRDNSANTTYSDLWIADKNTVSADNTMIVDSRTNAINQLSNGFIVDSDDSNFAGQYGFTAFGTYQSSAASAIKNYNPENSPYKCPDCNGTGIGGYKPFAFDPLVDNPLDVDSSDDSDYFKMPITTYKSEKDLPPEHIELSTLTLDDNKKIKEEGILNRIHYVNENSIWLYSIGGPEGEAYNGLCDEDTVTTRVNIAKTPYIVPAFIDIEGGHAIVASAKAKTSELSNTIIEVEFLFEVRTITRDPNSKRLIITDDLPISVTVVSRFFIHTQDCFKFDTVTSVDDLAKRVIFLGNDVIEVDKLPELSQQSDPFEFAENHNQVTLVCGDKICRIVYYSEAKDGRLYTNAIRYQEQGETDVNGDTYKIAEKDFVHDETNKRVAMMLDVTKPYHLGYVFEYGYMFGLKTVKRDKYTTDVYCHVGPGWSTDYPDGFSTKLGSIVTNDSTDAKCKRCSGDGNFGSYGYPGNNMHIGLNTSSFDFNGYNNTFIGFKGLFSNFGHDAVVFGNHNACGNKEYDMCETCHGDGRVRCTACCFDPSAKPSLAVTTNPDDFNPFGQVPANKEITCPDCQGYGLMPKSHIRCDMCKGDGYVNGNVGLPCVKCGQTGILYVTSMSAIYPCDRCTPVDDRGQKDESARGTGIVTTDEVVWSACPECSGYGRSVCLDCDGAGFLENYEHALRTSGCSVCRKPKETDYGKNKTGVTGLLRICPACEDWAVMCTICNGQGELNGNRCWNCEGTGITPRGYDICDMCKGDGKLSDDSNCPQCSGTGHSKTCTLCSGDKQVCDLCVGEGTIDCEYCTNIAGEGIATNDDSFKSTFNTETYTINLLDENGKPRFAAIVSEPINGIPVGEYPFEKLYYYNYTLNRNIALDDPYTTSVDVLKTTDNLLIIDIGDYEYDSEGWGLTIGYKYGNTYHMNYPKQYYEGAKSRNKIKDLKTGNVIESIDEFFEIALSPTKPNASFSRGFVPCFECNPNYLHSLEDCPWCNGRGRIYGTEWGDYDGGPGDFAYTNMRVGETVLDNLPGTNTFNTETDYNDVDYRSYRTIALNHLKSSLAYNLLTETVDPCEIPADAIDDTVKNFAGTTNLTADYNNINMNGMNIAAGKFKGNLCGLCNGRGYLDGIYKTCPACEGNGYKSDSTGVEYWWYTCPHCGDISKALSDDDKYNLISNNYSPLLYTVSGKDAEAVNMPHLRGKRKKDTTTKFGLNACETCNGVGMLAGCDDNSYHYKWWYDTQKPWTNLVSKKTECVRNAKEAMTFSTNGWSWSPTSSVTRTIRFAKIQNASDLDQELDATVEDFDFDKIYTIYMSLNDLCFYAYQAKPTADGKPSEENAEYTLVPIDDYKSFNTTEYNGASAPPYNTDVFNYGKNTSGFFYINKYVLIINLKGAVADHNIWHQGDPIKDAKLYIFNYSLPSKIFSTNSYPVYLYNTSSVYETTLTVLPNKFNSTYHGKTYSKVDRKYVNDKYAYFFDSANSELNGTQVALASNNKLTGSNIHWDERPSGHPSTKWLFPNTNHFFTANGKFKLINFAPVVREEFIYEIQNGTEVWADEITMCIYFDLHSKNFYYEEIGDIIAHGNKYYVKMEPVILRCNTDISDWLANIDDGDDALFKEIFPDIIAAGGKIIGHVTEKNDRHIALLYLTEDTEEEWNFATGDELANYDGEAIFIPIMMWTSNESGSIYGHSLGSWLWQTSEEQYSNYSVTKTHTFTIEEENEIIVNTNYNDLLQYCTDITTSDEDDIIIRNLDENLENDSQLFGEFDDKYTPDTHKVEELIDDTNDVDLFRLSDRAKTLKNFFAKYTTSEEVAEQFSREWTKNVYDYDGITPWANKLGLVPCPHCSNITYFHEDPSYAQLDDIITSLNKISIYSSNIFVNTFAMSHNLSLQDMRKKLYQNKAGYASFCDACNPNAVAQVHLLDGRSVVPDKDTKQYPEGSMEVCGIIDCPDCGNDNAPPGKLNCPSCLTIKHWYCSTCKGDGEVEYRPTIAYEDGKVMAVGDGYYYKNLYSKPIRNFDMYNDYINIHPDDNCNIGRGEYLKRMNIFSVENNGLLTVHNNNYDDIPTSDVIHNLNRDFFAVRSWAKYDSLSERFANLQNCCYATDGIFFPKRTAHNEEWKLRLKELQYLITDSYIKTNASMLKTNALNQAIADFYSNNTTYLLKLGPIISYAIKGVWHKGQKGSKGVKGQTKGTKGKKGMKGLKGLKGTKGSKGWYEKIMITNKRYKYTLADILLAVKNEYGQEIEDSGNLGKDTRTYTFYCLNEDSENDLYFKGVRIRQKKDGNYQTLNAVKGCKPYSIQRLVYKNNGYNGEYGIMNFNYSNNREFLT